MKITWRAAFFIILIFGFLAGVFFQKSKRVPQPVVTASPKVAGEQISNSEEPITFTVTLSAQKDRPGHSGVLVTNKGDDLLVLINKQIRLPATYVPSDLVVIDSQIGVKRWGMLLRKEAALSLVKMLRTAQREGVYLSVVSAYRSYQSQEITHTNLIKTAGVQYAERFSAKPGHSQHQLGTSVDFTITLLQTKENNWLAKNSYKFGFVLSYPEGSEGTTGYSYEPWHYRYIGVENAQEMIHSGLILEKFLQKYGVW